MTHNRMKLALGAAWGNALEFYDFATYAFFAVQIGETFFPSHDADVTLLASLATFGAGFVSRPLGAYVLGRYSDRAGRGPAMVAAMTIMGLGIALMVLCPGYATIGLAAPVIAVTARLLQGFALGGEIGASTAYLLECAPVAQRGLYVSFARGSQILASVIGPLVGLVLTLVLSPADFTAYGWRIALGLGLVLVPVAIVVRRRLPELPDPVHDAPGVATAAAPGGLRRAITLATLLFIGGGMTGYIVPYLGTIAQAKLDLTPRVALAGQVVANLVSLAFCVGGGMLSDRIGRRPVNIAGNLLTATLGTAAFALLIASPGLWSYVLAASALGAFISLQQTPMNVLVLESLPRTMRSFAYALVYTLPVTIFGGASQAVIAWLSHLTGWPMVVVWWTTSGSLIAVAAMTLLRETAPRRLARPNPAGTTVAGAI